MSRKPSEIAENICNIFGSKIKTPIGKVFLLAILAGAYIGFGGYLFVLVSSDASAYVGRGLTAFIGGVVFSLGLILIVLGGGELFTGTDCSQSHVYQERPGSLKSSRTGP